MLSNSPVKYTIVITVFLLSFLKSFAQNKTATDSISIAIAPEYDKVSKAHRFWFGDTYRKLWATPVQLKVFHLNKEKGGLTILQKGGGLQTKSLRLRDSTGQEWVLRTIQKYPENGMPEHLRGTVVKDILQDQVATAHPFASLTVPVFANALAISHSNPQIVFVPKDSMLGSYISEFGNAPFLFEEREPLSENTDNSEKVKRQLQKDNDNRIDQKAVLRARLMDMLLGDWDRHEDQWRWQRAKDESGILYTPVPRDRDMVFYNTSGIFPWIVSHQWLMSKFQGFHDKIRDIQGFNFNARYFDRYFLNSLSEEDWIDQAVYLQDHITDSVINAALHQLPAPIYLLSAEKLSKTLIARRQTLLTEAIKYYRFIAKTVDVPASDKHELFDIQYTPAGNALVKIYKIKKDGTKDKMIYQRLFIKDITKEVRLYGFEGNDIFSVTGDKVAAIKIRMIGGNDRDSFFIAPSLHNRKALYVYDQAGTGNVLPARSAAKIRVSSDSLVNSYDDKAFKYDRSGPLVLASYNIDYGLLIKLGFLKEKQGFRKDPYASKQQFIASYSTGRKSYIFDYSGDFKDVAGSNDLGINIVARGPNNTGNFFGIGNETEFINKGEQSITYYRCRYDIVNADVTLSHQLAKNVSVYGGVAGQYYTAGREGNATRFLGKFNTQFPGSNVFNDRVYAGLVTGLVLDSRNDSVLPSKGFLWHTSVTGMKQLNGAKDAYGKITSQLSWYLSTGKKANLVFANRTGIGATTGNPAFFQLLGIGGVQSMRGFHTNRFTGKSMLYHNLELRLKLFDFNSYILPGTVGLIAFNDVGRVWAKGEKSNVWHNSYGGGIYILPARLVLIQAVVGASKEGVLPYVTIGFRF
ncbi:MAG: BamA/TamA family outer membrane protein [Ferruginibacter sp.]